MIIVEYSKDIGDDLSNFMVVNDYTNIINPDGEQAPEFVKGTYVIES